MGSRRSRRCELLAMVAFSAILIPGVLAIGYVVGDKTGCPGDKTGWTTDFDYHAWAQGKVFSRGDSLIFNYKQGEHNVLKVNGTAFQKCVAPADVPPLTTGTDRIQLKTAGRKWYICSIGLHCDAGQKLVITVMDQGADPPSPSPSPPPLPPPSPSHLPTPSAPLPTNSTNAPPPAPSPATKAAVSGLVTAFSVLAGIFMSMA